MDRDIVQVSMKDVARFSIIRQHLSEKPGKRLNEKQKILVIFKDLKYVQIDPVYTVERSHFLTLWSRLGNFNRQNLLDLIYRDHLLVESYAHQASISIIDDLHILKMSMNERKERYLKTHPEIKPSIEQIKELIRSTGPTTSNKLSELKIESGISGWGHERKVNLLLNLMHRMGELIICDRTESNQKVWNVPDSDFSGLTEKNTIDRKEVEKVVFQKSLESLGIASPEQIKRHYSPVSISNGVQIVNELQDESVIVPVEITNNNSKMRKKWFILKKDIPYLENLENNWMPPSVLLSPFDNLTIDRKRTEEIFNFDSRMEMYIPEHKRKYGFYCMPFLHGDRIIGRVDLKLDRYNSELKINAIYDEGRYFSQKRVLGTMIDSLNSLSEFLNASSIKIPQTIQYSK
ncbi:MAG: crosslink repair DNA glycosylase YcaQ family protein [Cuniculiplasma divulgatum]|jgi:uncharacterized protein YcaQ